MEKRPSKGLDMWAGALLEHVEQSSSQIGVSIVGGNLGTQNSRRSEEGWYGGVCPGSDRRERSFTGVTMCGLEEYGGNKMIM